MATHLILQKILRTGIVSEPAPQPRQAPKPPRPQPGRGGNRRPPAQVAVCA